MNFKEHSKTYSKKYTQYYQNLIEVRVHCVDVVLVNEIKFTISKLHLDINFDEWKLQKSSERKRIRISVSYNMGCN